MDCDEPKLTDLMVKLDIIGRIRGGYRVYTSNGDISVSPPKQWDWFSRWYNGEDRALNIKDIESLLQSVYNMVGVLLNKLYAHVLRKLNYDTQKNHQSNNNSINIAVSSPIQQTIIAGLPQLLNDSGNHTKKNLQTIMKSYYDDLCTENISIEQTISTSADYIGTSANYVGTSVNYVGTTDTSSGPDRKGLYEFIDNMSLDVTVNRLKSFKTKLKSCRGDLDMTQNQTDRGLRALLITYEYDLKMQSQITIMIEKVGGCIDHIDHALALCEYGGTITKAMNINSAQH